MPSFIIAGYMWQFLGRVGGGGGGGVFGPPSICEQPQKRPSWIGLRQCTNPRTHPSQQQNKKAMLTTAAYFKVLLPYDRSGRNRTSFIFVYQKGCFRYKTEKVNTIIEFCIFELIEVPNFRWKLQFCFVGPNLRKKRCFWSKKKKLTSQLNSAFSKKPRYQISA